MIKKKKTTCREKNMGTMYFSSTECRFTETVCENLIFSKLIFPLLEYELDLPRERAVLGGKVGVQNTHIHWRHE